MDAAEADEFILMPLERLINGAVPQDVRQNFFLEKTVATFSDHSNPTIAAKAKQLLHEWKESPVERATQKKRLRQEREATTRMPTHRSRKSQRRERAAPQQRVVPPPPPAPPTIDFSRFNQLDHSEMPSSLFVKFTNDGEYLPADVLRDKLAGKGLTKLTIIRPKPHYYHSALSLAATKELMNMCPPNAPRGGCRFWPRCNPHSGYCPFWHPAEEDVREVAERDILRWTGFLCIHGQQNTEEVFRLLNAEPCVDNVEHARVKEYDGVLMIRREDIEAYPERTPRARGSNQRLGKGTFGEVKLGLMRGMPVALKMFIPPEGHEHLYDTQGKGKGKGAGKGGGKGEGRYGGKGEGGGDQWGQIQSNPEADRCREELHKEASILQLAQQGGEK
jgi:hypothetical protein